MTKRTFALLLGTAVLVGAALRLYGIAAQILIDDEWHGMSFVLGKTYGEILSSFNPNDNSSPLLNVYTAWLLDAFGWSEIGLRAPSIVAGLGSLILLPLSIRRIVGDRAAVLFAFLLAISPFLVFYSRFSRAYALVALAGFQAIVSLTDWAGSGRNRPAIVFVVAAAVSIALHIAALVAVFVPLGIVAAIKLLDLRNRSGATWPKIAPDLRSIAAVVLALAALTAGILVPVIQTSSDLPWRDSSLTWRGLAGTAAMAAGTANPVAALAVVALSALGIATLFRAQTVLAWIVAATAVAYAAVLAVTRPKGVDQPIVVLRYAMPLVPFGLLLAAVGADRVLRRVEEAPAAPRWMRLAGAGAAAVALVVLVVAGPLRETYAMPNNFTNHSAFQGGYARHARERSDARHVYPGPVVTASEIPAFYRTLAQDASAEAIVEYPYDICNYNNIFYFVQRHHRKTVIAGYMTDKRLLGHGIRLGASAPAEPFQIGMLTVDEILARVPDPRRLAFRNMVPLEDPERLRRCGADYLVLHKSLDALAVLAAGYGRATVDYKSTPILAAFYATIWGAPAFEDERIVVFRIPKTAG